MVLTRGGSRHTSKQLWDLVIRLMSWDVGVRPSSEVHDISLPLTLASVSVRRELYTQYSVSTARGEARGTFANDREGEIGAGCRTYADVNVALGKRGPPSSEYSPSGPSNDIGSGDCCAEVFKSQLGRQARRDVLKPKSRMPSPLFSPCFSIEEHGRWFSAGTCSDPEHGVIKQTE